MRTKKGADALFPEIRKQILAALLMRADREWFASDLARHLKVPKTSLQRELEHLHSAGIIQRRVEGKHVYYRADRANPIFPELRSIMAKTAGLVDVIREALRPVAKRINLAFVYGSVAGVRESAASDVDLLIVGKVGLVDLALPLRKASETLSREVNPTVYGLDEFRRKASTEGFVSSLLHKDKLFVIGSDDDLETTLGRSTHRTRGASQGRTQTASRGRRTKSR